MTFFGVLALIFIVLKLVGVIAWSWFLVLLPIIIPFVIAFIAVALLFAIHGVDKGERLVKQLLNSKKKR